MRKILFILLLFTSFTSYGAVYYISPTGDNGNTGAVDSPWRSLSYACSQVTTADNIIHVLPGTYTENARCVLAPRVSIEGSSQGACIINFTYAASGFSNGSIYAVSSSVVNGNQSISHLTITGSNYTSERGIYVRYRSNFTIHHVTISKFDKSGINAYSEIDWVTPPTTYTTGLKIYNCTIDDCSEAPCTGNECNLRWSGHSGYEIYNNVISNSTRVAQDNMYSSQVKNGSFHNNTVTTREAISGYYIFAMELWNNRGGVSIYENDFIGGGAIDIGGHTTEKGIYDYGVSIHDNSFNLSAIVAYNSIPTTAITIECWVSIESVYVYNNYIHNFPWAINITCGQPGADIDGIHIYANVIDGVSNTNVSWNSFGIGIIEQETVDTRSNINIYNNTIVGNLTNSYRGIIYAVDGTNDDIEIKNNIIQGFDYGVRVDNYSGTINALHLVNNLIHDCSYTVSIQAGVSSTNYLNTGQLTSNPLFVSSSDYHLQSSSPALGGGVYVGLSRDYDGNLWANPPSIGAYEGEVPPIEILTTAVINIGEETATSGGNIISDGGFTITARGVCWNTTGNPTTSDDKSTNGTGTGEFVSAIHSLTAGTTYYVRAYGTNSQGTAYGNQRSFTTADGGTPGIVPINLLEYNGVLIIYNGKFLYIE